MADYCFHSIGDVELEFAYQQGPYDGSLQCFGCLTEVHQQALIRLHSDSSRLGDLVDQLLLVLYI